MGIQLFASSMMALVFLCTASPVFSEADVALDTPIDAPNTSVSVIESSNPATSGITVYKLKTGQTLYVKPIHSQPIVTVDTWLNVGSAQEIAENNGLSHFLEHLLFKGTPRYPSGKIERLLSERGAEFNAETSKDTTHYYITVGKPYLNDILDIHADMLLNAEIPKAELDAERAVVQEEINRALDTPDRKIFNTLVKAMFPEHPYEVDTLGPKENIATIPREGILNYFQTWYQPANMTTVVVGDVTPDEAKTMVEGAFNKALALQQKTVPMSRPKLLPVPELTGGPVVKVLSDPNVSEPSLLLVFPAPGSDVMMDNLALDVAMQVLGQGHSSRLAQQLKEEKEVARSADGGNYTFQQAGMIYFSVETTMAQLAAARTALLDEIQKFSQAGLSDAEFEKVKKQTQKDFVFLTESTQGYANTLGRVAVLNQASAFTDYLAGVKKLSPEQVQSVFNRYVDLKRGILIELLPGSATAAQVASEEKMASAFLNDHCRQNAAFCDAAVLANTTLLDDKTLAAPASVAITHKPMVSPVSQCGSAKASSVTTKKEVLPNGMVLITRHIPDAQTAAIEIMFKGGRLASSRLGLPELSSRLFLKGTKTMSAGKLAAYLERNGIQLNASLQNDYYGLHGLSMSEDFPTLLAVLDELLSEPQAPQDELNKEREYMLQEVRTRRDVPRNRLFELMTDRIFPEHPYGTSGEELEAALPAYTRDDVLRFYRDAILQPNHAVMSVVGNFDDKALRDRMRAIEQHLLANKTDLAASRKSVRSLRRDVMLRDKKPKLAATWIAKAWQAPAVSEQRDYVPTKVLASVLGGGFSSRLFDHLRKEKGMAYETASFYLPYVEKGNFALYIGTDPKNEQAVLKGIDAEISALRRTPIPAEELDQNKRELIGQFLLGHEGTAAQATYLALYETMGLGYGFDTRYPSLLEKVTSADVLRMAKKLFTSPQLTVIVSPASVRLESE